MDELLLAGLPIRTKSGLDVYPLTLKEIAMIGINVYNFNVSLFTLEKYILSKMLNGNQEALDELLNNKYETFLSIVFSDKSMQEIVLGLLEKITRKECKLASETKILINGKDMVREDYKTIIDALSLDEELFLELLLEKSTRDEMLGILSSISKKKCLVVDRGIYIGDSILDKDTYEELVDILELQNCYKSRREIEEEKSDNPMIQKLLDKRNAYRDKLKKAKQYDEDEEAPQLTDLISSLCYMSSNINILNVWNLTLYQLYNMISRYNLKNQFDISIKSIMAGASSSDVDLKNWIVSLEKNNEME